MAEAKPISKPLNILRWSWGIFLVSLLLFSIVMASWGDLREGLMLKVLDDRYVKSFTFQAPEGAKLWVGSQYLGVAEPHPLAANEPADSDTKVEGLSVLLPRVYLYEPQLMENSVECEPTTPSAELLKQLAPDAKLLWAERDSLAEAGFFPALLQHDDGRLDLVNLCRVDWPKHEGGFTRRAFLLRMIVEDSHTCRLQRTELWSDQLYADDGGFWAKREQWDDYPPRLSGQSKTVWRWFVTPDGKDADWLKSHVAGEFEDIRWFKLSEKK